MKPKEKETSAIKLSKEPWKERQVHELLMMEIPETQKDAFWKYICHLKHQNPTIFKDTKLQLKMQVDGVKFYQLKHSSDKKAVPEPSPRPEKNSQSNVHVKAGNGKFTKLGSGNQLPLGKK